MRYVPTPYHTKFAQQRTALSQYIQQEAVGTRMRRWNRPLHDFLMPYLRGMVERTTGESIIPRDVERRRDLDTLADMLTSPGPFRPAQHIFPRAREGRAGPGIIPPSAPITKGSRRRENWPGCEGQGWG